MSNKKLHILGAGGMAGHVMYYFLKSTQKYDISNSVHNKKISEDSIVIDITNKEEVKYLISKLRPDIVINCTGILIKGSNDHPDNAILINAYLPHLLQKLGHEFDSKIIHLSTDCVFSGKKGSYFETDSKDADNIYGRSKALGEISGGKNLTIRTSKIGPELKKDGEGLFHWFMLQTGTIKGYTNSYWSGVTTLELAKAIHNAITNDLSGMFHLTNGEKISKYELLSLIKQIWFRNDIIIEKFEGSPIDRSIMKSSKYDFHVPGYIEMLNELKQWMDQNKYLYQSLYPLN
jgi:dTDP-4-dehydrorhamnose reductase